MLEPEYLPTMRNALTAVHQGTGEFIRSHGSLPASGSQADQEKQAFPRPQSIVSAWALGAQLIEFGGEYLTAFVTTVTEPVEVIACWTCVRSMLESCSLSAWLLDPAADAHARVGRTFALRYEGLEQQIRFCRAIGRPQSEIDSLEARIPDRASGGHYVG